ncbi:MAG: hypothetical protein Q7T87_12575 [Polaromonas sp.]|nr:hypothetical protein [Polaromonas sp.]
MSDSCKHRFAQWAYNRIRSPELRARLESFGEALYAWMIAVGLFGIGYLSLPAP